MTEYPFILFRKSPEQLRRLGARGGRAHGHNQRARSALVPTPPEAVLPRAAPQETTAAAIHVLDAQFPWLRGAENRLRTGLPGEAGTLNVRARDAGWTRSMGQHAPDQACA